MVFSGTCSRRLLSKYVFFRTAAGSIENPEIQTESSADMNIISSANKTNKIEVQNALFLWNIMKPFLMGKKEF